LAVTFIIQIAFVSRAFLPFYELNRTEKRITDRIKSLHPGVLYTFGMEGALRSYGYAGKIISLWPEKMDSVVSGSVLLFNRSGNQKQWGGKNPMINFNLIRDSAGAVLREADDGWEIYEINQAYPPARSGFSVQ
jgi:hypothetical protein